MCQIRSIRLRPHSLRPSNLIPPELAQQRELIEAAIAVNEAPTLADAFQALADTGATLLGCDRLTIVAWNDDLSVGTIRGDTGTSLGELASPIDGSAATIRAEAVYAGPAQVAGGGLQEFAFVVRVPLITASGVATFHALWLEPLGDDEATRAAELVRMLTR